MVVSSGAKMSVVALFSILLMLISQAIFSSQAVLSTVESLENELPHEGECGTLNTNYYNNLKKTTEIDEFPWMGRVLYENVADHTFWFKCYCTLISKNFVLMNAVCFDYKEEPSRIYMGDWNAGNDKFKSDCDDNGRCAPVPQAFELDEIIIHRNYNSKFKNNDIALVKLNKPVKYSDFIRPICLPSRDEVQNNYANKNLEVTGWYFNSNVSAIKAKTFVRVVSLKTCEEKMKHFTVDKKTNICAYTCSGSFVFRIASILMDIKTVNAEPGYYYLIGFNTHGLEICSLLYPDVYIRVDRYLDWIYDNMALSLL